MSKQIKLAIAGACIFSGLWCVGDIILNQYELANLILGSANFSIAAMFIGSKD